MGGVVSSPSFALTSSRAPSFTSWTGTRSRSWSRTATTAADTRKQSKYYLKSKSCLSGAVDCNLAYTRSTTSGLVLTSRCQDPSPCHTPMQLLLLPATKMSSTLSLRAASLGLWTATLSPPSKWPPSSSMCPEIRLSTATIADHLALPTTACDSGHHWGPKVQPAWPGTTSYNVQAYCLWTWKLPWPFLHLRHIWTPPRNLKTCPPSLPQTPLTPTNTCQLSAWGLVCPAHYDHY